MPTIKLERVNKLKVKRIPIEKDERPILGEKITGDTCYTNICQVAPTFGDKTTSTLEILKVCSHKKTKIVAFVSTIYEDKNWEFIQEWAEERGMEFYAHD